MYRTIQFVVLTAVVVFGMSAVAQADHIHVPTLLDVSNSNAVLFNADFENGTVGSAPANPEVGTWTCQQYTNTTVYVQDQTSTGIPANEGEKFLRITKNANAGAPYLTGNSIAYTGTDHLLKLTLAYRPTTGTKFAFEMFSSAETIGQFGFGIRGTNSVDWYAGGADWDTTPLTQTVNLDQWNTIVIKHLNGSTDWSISTNGSAFETRTWSGSGGTAQWSKFKLITSGAAEMSACIDAVPVPEPSTLALLACGLIGLLCYAWRKRK